MAPPVVARLTNVTKEYRLYQERSNFRSLIPGERGVQHGETLFRALHDVSFEVAAGEAVGIIGANGAGKSTVLKLLAGILGPTTGSVRTWGRIASIIELGVGFDPELTGRENIVFAGDMLGYSRRELTAKRDWIIDFSGIEEFLDMPVKRYSTGMVARLGFSIASAMRADLLLVDEVLSVGDINFQRKSLERIKELHREGTALVLVSHSLWTMHAICDRLLLLDHGVLTLDGAPAEVVGEYIGPEVVAEPDPEVPAARFIEYTVPASLLGKVTIDELVADPPVILPNQSVVIRAQITVRVPIKGLIVMSVYTSERAIFAEREAGPVDLLTVPGCYTVEARIAAVPLGTGKFDVRLAVLPEDDRHHDQIYPEALAIRTTELEIDGGLTARPGVKFDMTWEARLEHDLTDQQPRRTGT